MVVAKPFGSDIATVNRGSPDGGQLRENVTNRHTGGRGLKNPSGEGAQTVAIVG